MNGRDRNMSLRDVLLVLLTVLVFEGGQSWEEVLAAEGSVVVLPCVDKSGSLSYPTSVHWSKRVGDSLKTVWSRTKSGLEFRPVINPLRAKCSGSNFGGIDYSLYIDGVSLTNGGQYQCLVEGKKSTIVRDIILRVIRASISPAVVVEGSRVEANCQVLPVPHILSIKWKLNGEMIHRNSFPSVSQRNAGNLSCEVSCNNLTVEATTSLQVRGISTPRDNSSVFYAAVDSSFSLPCIFTDGLLPNSVTWRKISLSNNDHPLPESFEHSSGLIFKVNDGDEGMYRCSGAMMRADGRKTTVHRTMKLVVAQVVSSSLSGMDTVTLSCQLSSFDLITDYEWLRVTPGPNNTQTLTIVQKSSSFRVEVTEAVPGEWICRFYSHQRLLGNVTYHFHITGAIKSEKISSSSKTALVMGLGFLFLVTFLVLLQMYRNHQRRKRILQYPAIEGLVHQAAIEREWKERSREKMAEECPRNGCIKLDVSVTECRRL